MIKLTKLALSLIMAATAIESTSLSAASTAVNTVQAANISGIVDINYNANLRSGPGTTYRIVRVLPQGERYRFSNAVFSGEYVWYEVGHDQWVASSAASVESFN